MSIASKIATVRFSPKAGTYTAIIQSPSGDLYQEYTGTQTDPGAIQPDYTPENNHPKLVFIAVSSRSAEGVINPTEIQWYFNGTLIHFVNGISDNDFYGETGHFEEVQLDESKQQYYWGITIKKNLVKAAGAAPCTIKAVAKVKFRGIEDTLQAQYVIPIRRSTGSPYFVTIASGDNKYFTIREKGGSCVLKAMVYQSGVQITEGLEYHWYKLSGTTWNTIFGGNTNTITVSGNDVDCYANYKVEVAKNNNLIGSDIQGVMDASDPYDIIPNPTPEDETIRNPPTESNPTGDTVVYTPKLVKRGTQVALNEGTLYNFNAIDSVGNDLGHSGSGGAASFTVTYGMCEQAGTDVQVYIETTI